MTIIDRHYLPDEGELELSDGSVIGWLHVRSRGMRSFTVVRFVPNAAGKLRPVASRYLLLDLRRRSGVTDA